MCVSGKIKCAGVCGKIVWQFYLLEIRKAILELVSVRVRVWMGAPLNEISCEVCCGCLTYMRRECEKRDIYYCYCNNDVWLRV